MVSLIKSGTLKESCKNPTVPTYLLRKAISTCNLGMQDDETESSINKSFTHLKDTLVVSYGSYNHNCFVTSVLHLSGNPSQG